MKVLSIRLSTELTLGFKVDLKFVFVLHNVKNHF